MGKSRKTKQELHERVLAGEEKTTNEWADELCNHLQSDDSRRGAIRCYLSQLRKEGVMIFPLPLNGERIAGILKIVNDNLEQFGYVYHKHASRTVEAGIISNFNIAEIFMKEHPSQKKKIIARATHLIEISIASQKESLGISYVPSRKLGTLEDTSR